MTDVIQLAKGKLDDPILMDWALDRHREAEEGAQRHREAMEQAWFDDLTLRRWLDSDDQDILTRLFSQLPAERFANLGQAIGERWGLWSGHLACHSAPVLAQYEPDLAWKCFAEPEGGRHRDSYTVLGIVRALPLLSSDSGQALLRAIAEQMRTSQTGGMTRDLMRGELISVGLQIDRQAAQEVIRARLEGADDERILDDTLNRISLGLFGNGVYPQLASEIRKNETRQRFQPLGALFEDDAPLEQLDRWSRGPVNLSDLTGLVDEILDEVDRAVILSVTETLKAEGLAKNRDRIADFLIGSVAAACERGDLDTSGMSLLETVRLLSADLSGPRHFEPLLARLSAFDPEEVASVLAQTLEREKATWGSVTLAQVMGRLGWNQFLPYLTDAMSQECGDFLCEAAQDALALVGEPAQEHLIRHWDTLDSSQRIYGVSVVVAVGGDPAASFALDRYDDLMNDDPEYWCRLAAAAPDRRLLDLVEQQLPRQQRPFDEAFYPLARLLDVDHPQLDAVSERIRKRNAEQRARMAALDRGDWRQDTLNLVLRCTDCGEVNEYRVRRIAFNPEEPDGSLLIAQEFVCASCGNWADFEFTTEAKLAVTAELVALAADSDAGLAGKSKVLIRAEAPLNGRVRPVGEVVSHCRAAVAKHPGSIGDWVRLAYCYHQVLSRPRFGVNYTERALSLEANAVEAVILKADALTVEGRDAQAFALLAQALASKERWRFFLADVAPRAGVAAQFARFYNELLRRLGRTDRASLHASFLGAGRKVGRNDPCPCGSGKKYKKCCLAKS